MEGFLLSEIDFACPICLERLKDPFVTQCGHSFCYSCITTHLQNKSVCPCCSDYLTQDKVFPNYLLNKAVENVAKAKIQTEGTLVEQLHAAINSKDSALGLADVDALLETLEEKKSEMQKRKKENNLELLLHFLNHSKSSKVKKLGELQGELHILDKDIHHVETKHQKALPAPGPQLLPHTEAGPSAPALPTLPTLASHTWLQNQMRARGREGPPPVTVEDVSATRGTPGSQEGYAQAGQGGRHGGGGLQRQPSTGSRAATPPSNLYQSNGQHLSTSVLGLGHSSSGRATPDHCAQAGGPGPAPRPPTRQASVPNEQLQGFSSQSRPSSLPAHSGTTPPPLPHTSGAGRSQTASQSSSPPPWPPPQPPADQGAASWSGVHPHPLLHRGMPVEGGTQATAAEPEASSGMVADSGGTSRTTRSSSGLGASGGMRYRTLSNKRPFESQYEDLQRHYLRMRQKQMGESKRRRVDAGTPRRESEVTADGVGDAGAATGVSSDDGEGIEPGDLQEFSRMLSMTTKRSKLEVVASMPGASQNTSAAILSSVAFDKHALNFATAGVSKRISVYNYADAVTTYAVGQTGEVVDQPRVQLRSRSKLSCLSWNCFQESHLMSSDYEGVITLWDTHTLQPVTEYEAHNKRVWSVDFCPSNAQLLVSGSDDGCVKIWAMNQSSSVAEIDLRANVCSVKYSPVNEHELAVGSADHNVLLYDTRRCASPLHVFSGHKKAVSYVVYMGDRELVSASTDSSLRLWSIGEGKAVRKYAGHVNEKNFVGLSAEGDFVACGSETSQICVFYRAMSRPITRTLFSPQPSRSDAASRSNSRFISALCWKPQSEKKILVAANSQGAIKILQLQCS